MTAVGIIASAYVAPASGGGGTFINHVAIAGPRNGTTTHTVDPNGGTVAAGTNFTPTAGRFLVVVVEGPVTSTTPTGWTLEASAVNATGLYAWSRVAAGADTFTTTHNAANYVVMFHWFEFAAGSTWVGDVTNNAVAAANANPNLTGLTGTNVVMAAKASVDAANDAIAISGAWSASTIEILDYHDQDIGTTDGYWLGIGYQTGYTSASYQPTCTVTGTGTPCETITFAVNAT